MPCVTSNRLHRFRPVFGRFERDGRFLRNPNKQVLNHKDVARRNRQVGHRKFMVSSSLRAVRSEKKAAAARAKFGAPVSLGGRSLGKSVNPADLGCFMKWQLLSNTLRICRESPGSASNLRHNSCDQGATTEPSEGKKRPDRHATRPHCTKVVTTRRARIVRPPPEFRSTGAWPVGCDAAPHLSRR